MNTIQRKDSTDFDVTDGPSAAALAIVVLQERVSRLCKEDKDDLYELLPLLFTDDPEEKASAFKAVKEIFDQSPGKVSGALAPVTPGQFLQTWIEYVSQRILEARTSAGMTQVQLAEKSGLLQGHISRLEKGQYSPTAKTLEKIAKATGKELSYFDPSA